MSESPILLTYRNKPLRDENYLSLPLTAEERTRLRGRRLTSCGCEVLLQLPREGSLSPGDVLSGDDRCPQVLVEAAIENLLIVRANTSLELMIAAYHLGNRHVRVELHRDELLLMEDSVLAGMLQARGLTVEISLRPFFPEPGAYQDNYSHQKHS